MEDQETTFENNGNSETPTELEEFDPNALDHTSWRPHMCQFFREAILRVSRNELGKMIKVSPASIRLWEDPKTNQAPSRPNLIKLCRAFGCEIFELYSDFDPAYTQEFLKDVFKTWSFVLQRSIRSDSVSEKKFALNLTQLFMDYDERRREWESENPKDENSIEVESSLDKIMFEKQMNGQDLDEDVDIEEGSEIDIDEEGQIKELPPAPEKTIIE